MLARAGAVLITAGGSAHSPKGGDAYAYNFNVSRSFMDDNHQSYKQTPPLGQVTVFNV